jgi:NADH dehydrogenase [ubiquinone] 1 alpha subcomplex assembly factor 7
MSLTARLEALIREHGPMTVAQFMDACLHDPVAGYYATRPRLGVDGDFITAPMVSQMFGEILGAWAIGAWRGLGRPARVLLVEVGPGDGTLMGDLLRTARLDRDFLAALEVWLIETSSPLTAAQRARLSDVSPAPNWAESLDDAPADAPMLLIANEVLDCLPVRQFVRVEAGWAERMVGLDGDGGLCFGLKPAPAITDPAPLGALLEVSSAQQAFAAQVGARIAGQGGAALLIDYGRDRPDFGDTLQALQGHRKVDVLETAGEADLTVHADFPAVRAAAAGQGVGFGLRGQGDFLRSLGVEARAEVLRASRADQAEIIDRQLARLTGDDQMGLLFKVACLYADRSSPPPGFETPDA